MPENYTITTFNFIEEILDSIYAGSMITGGTMTITPDPNYVVSAANFSHGTLPESIATCVFTDTGTAGQPGNTVLVTFTFGPLLQITSNLPPIYIHINGDAQVYREDDRSITFDIDLIDNTIKNLNGSTASTAGVSITKSPSSETIDGNGLQTTNLSGTIPSGVPYTIATITTLADSNYHFNDPPTIRVENIPEEVVSLVFSSVLIRNSDNEVTKWEHKLMFGSNSNLSSLSGGKVFIEYKGIADRSSTKEILKVVYGDPEVSANGATRTVKVVGDVGAEFDLTVTKNSDNTSIMDVNLTNADILHPGGGLIRGINKTLVANETNELIAEHEFVQIYPASGSNEIYHINVIPKNGTILNSNLPQTPPQGIIYQYTNPVLTLRATTTNVLLANQTDIVYTGRPNSTPSRLKHIKKIKEIFQIDYTVANSAGRPVTKVDDDPKWSSAVSTNSDWTNSVYADNGGTHIEIINIVTTYGTPATLKADVIVKKFGNASTTMLLNLDHIFAAV